MTKEVAEKIVRGITDKIECNTVDIDDWAEFWGFTREEYEDFLDMAIKALEQGLCPDVISRSDMLDAVGHGTAYTSEDLQKIIKGLPPVNPQPNKEDIHREREQAYMLGYEDGSRKYRTELCGDCVSKQAVLDLIEHYNSDGLGSVFYGYEEGVKFADAVNKLPPVTPQPKTGWIPMTTRPMTEEERKHYIEWSDVDRAMIFDCELPEDGQEVLVSSGDYVCLDTFCTDDGCYFEGVDIDDVDAWMPKPKPYKPQESEDKK